MDTIAAIATHPGRAGIGIIRISGKQAKEKCCQLFTARNRNISDLPARQLTLGWWHEEPGGTIIDEVMVVAMIAPHSYTKEDVIEVQCHGGNLVVNKILTAILRQGIRLAEPGEFTKRAFLNGRIDLAQAEAVSDIICAQTDAGLLAAQRQLSGLISSKIIELRKQLLAVLAALEVAIDYAGEDIVELSDSDIQRKLLSVHHEIKYWLTGCNRGKIVREGVNLAIIGKPNAGKSSLLNVLLREERAIVSDIPGTTRDTIEESIVLAGIKCKIIDTAGIRETFDAIETIGVERSLRAIADADIVLYLIDSAIGISDEDRAILATLHDKQYIIINSKQDLLTDQALQDEYKTDSYSVSISVQTGQGLNELETAIAELLPVTDVCDDESLNINARHHMLLLRADEAMHNAIDAIGIMPPECLAVDLQSAWAALGEITGETASDDIVDRIFADFCLGK